MNYYELAIVYVLFWVSHTHKLERKTDGTSLLEPVPVSILGVSRHSLIDPTSSLFCRHMTNEIVFQQSAALCKLMFTDFVSLLLDSCVWRSLSVCLSDCSCLCLPASPFTQLTDSVFPKWLSIHVNVYVSFYLQIPLSFTSHKYLFCYHIVTVLLSYCHSIGTILSLFYYHIVTLLLPYCQQCQTCNTFCAFLPVKKLRLIFFPRFCLFDLGNFSDASSYLHTRVCPSVGPSVLQSIGRSTAPDLKFSGLNLYKTSRQNTSDV